MIGVTIEHMDVPIYLLSPSIIIIGEQIMIE